MRFRSILLSLLFLVSALGLPVQAQRRPFTPTDLWSLKRLGGLTATRAGDRLAVVVTSTNLKENKSNGDIWMIHCSTGEATQFTTGKNTESSPAWSPDGSMLAFVAKREDNEKSQVYVISASGGEARQLTDLPLGASSPRWYPDGKHIAVVSETLPQFASDPDSLKAELKRRKDRKVTMMTSENRVVRYWDHPMMEGTVQHLFSVDVTTKEVRDLTPHLDRWSGLDGSVDYDISPDGLEIVFVAFREGPPYSDITTDLYLVPSDGSGVMTCITTDNPGSDMSPRYSKDGRYLLYGRETATDRNAERVKLMRRDRKSGELKELLTDFDRSPGNWQTSTDGRLVVFTAEDSARTSLFSVGIEGGRPRRILHHGTNSGMVLAGSTMYFLHQNLSRPAEVFSMDVKGGSPRLVTRFNEELLKNIDFGSTGEFFFTGADGDQVHSHIIYPPGFDARRKWPLLVVLHGGPHGTSGDDFHPRWNTQLFAAQGWVVIAPNFHGSSSFGEQFAECINGAHGDKPFQDVMAAVDAVLRMGFVDSTRMACSGGSYGGYLTSWIGANTNRFACLVVHAGVYNLLGQFASDVTHNRDVSYGGTPWEKPEAILRWSPAHHAAGFTTPTLVMHGEKDYRVPVTQGLELYGMLKARGVPARLALFPDENHWIAAPRNSIAWYEEFAAWVHRWLKIPGDNEAGSQGKNREGQSREVLERKK